MDIVQRVLSILSKPKEEWAKIKAEPATTAQFFRSYVLVLAALPSVFQFLARVLIERIPMQGHWGLGPALVGALVGYALDLATIYVFALILYELAPTFASTKSMIRALELAAYSMTPVWLAGIFNIIPRFWALSVVAALYGFYLLYLGFDAPMMETPKNRVLGYAAVAGVVIVVLAILNVLINFAFRIRFIRAFPSA